MVPAWVTVVTTLGSALIAGTTALLVNWHSGHNEALREERARREAEQTQLRAWRQGVAASYASHFLGSWVAVKHAVDTLPLAPATHQQATNDADWLVHELPTFLGPVLLMFGTDVEHAAEAARAQLEEALELAHQHDAAKATAALQQTRDLRAAYDALIRMQLGSQ